MVVPALGILMNESYFEKFPAFLPYLQYLGNPTHQQLIIFGLMALAASFILKNIFYFFFKSTVKVHSFIVHKEK